MEIKENFFDLNFDHKMAQLDFKKNKGLLALFKLLDVF